MIYFDNAATTFPKPRSVIREVEKCLTKYCGNAGRGSHFLSLAAAEKIFDCRCMAAAFFGVGEPENVFFTYNTTYALNTVIKGIAKRGDHFIIGDMEHNSVYRPIYKLATEKTVTYDIFKSISDGKRLTDYDIIKNISDLIKPNTKAVVCSHSSNICSSCMPVDKIGALCRERGIMFVLDAAQSAGHIDIDVRKMNISALCAPAHKGLYGIQGCGLVALGEGVTLETLIEGGSGTTSLSGEMPTLPPERYEAGTLSVPCIASLIQGIEEVTKVGTEEIQSKETRLFTRLREYLLNTEGFTVYMPDEVGGVLLFNLNDVPPERVAAYLSDKKICVRAGYHCSALGHKTLGTETGGAVRVSFGMFNTVREIDELYSILKKIPKQLQSLR